MAKLPPIPRVGFAILGGLALALISLIKANFYLTPEMVEEALIGVMTVVSYVVLAGIVGAVYPDEEGPDIQKLRRGAFLSGLAAPSLLFTLIATQPALDLSDGPPTPTFNLDEGSANSIIDDLFEFLVPPLYAQSIDPSVAKVKAKTTTREALLAAFGKYKLKGSVYLVGSSKSGERAVSFATSCNSALAKTRYGSGSAQMPQFQVISVDDKPGFHVTLGGVLEKRSNVKFVEKASKSIAKALLEHDPRCSDLVLFGDMVSVKSLRY